MTVVLSAEQRGTIQCLSTGSVEKGYTYEEEKGRTLESLCRLKNETTNYIRYTFEHTGVNLKIEIEHQIPQFNKIRCITSGNR